MTIKKAIGKLHLWLGFTSGLVVFIVAITGCLYAFQYDIQEWMQSYRHVEPQDAPMLPPSEIRSIVTKELPGMKLHGIIYSERDRAISAVFYNDDPEYYYLVYVNPYTGEVLQTKNMMSGFFYQVLQGHYYLWLPHEVGQPIVAYSTLIFVVMLITGMILWWPGRKNVKQRFTIKWNARWRRKNYDLHNVLGFYILSIGLVLALTGLVWGFTWFNDGLYKIAGGEKSLMFEEPHSVVQSASVVSNPVDKLWMKTNVDYPEAKMIEVHFPETDSSGLEVAINTSSETYWSTDYHYYDQYTLEELDVNHLYGKIEDATAADKLIRMNYDIHTGAILGFAGKLLAFFASLIIASLPVSGVLIWWGRRNKEVEVPQMEQQPVNVAVRPVYRRTTTSVQK